MVSLLPRTGATSGALALFSLGVMAAPPLAASFHAASAAFATPLSALKPLSSAQKVLTFVGDFVL